MPIAFGLTRHAMLRQRAARISLEHVFQRCAKSTGGNRPLTTGRRQPKRIHSNDLTSSASRNASHQTSREVIVSSHDDVEPTLEGEAAESSNEPVPSFEPLPATSVTTPLKPNLDKLTFESRTYIHAGRRLPIPEAHHIGEYKVKLRVKLADLGLDPLAQQRLIYMTGCRYKPNKKELVLTCEKFPSRIENKTYVTHQLEQLMQVASQPDPEFDESYARDQADRAARKLLRYRH